MDDVEAAIQALEWGKNEFLSHTDHVSSASIESPASSPQTSNRPPPRTQTIDGSAVAAHLTNELSQTRVELDSARRDANEATAAATHIRAELSRTRVELEATKRRCHTLQTDRDVQRVSRATSEKDLLASRTVQTQQNAQLHAEIRSLQQQLWQAKQEVEHMRAKEQQSQVQMSSALLNVDQLRQRLSRTNQDHANALITVQRKLDHALAERDSAVLEARQLKMGNNSSGRDAKNTGATGGNIVGSTQDDGDVVDSLPQQVAKRLRQAASANEELVRKLDSAEKFARETKMLMDNLNVTKTTLEQRETQLQAFEAALRQALSKPKQMTHVHDTQVQASQTSFTSASPYTQSPQPPQPPQPPYQTSSSSFLSRSTSPLSMSSEHGGGLGNDRRGVDLARRAEVVASSASNMLHLLTSKHTALLSHVSELRHQLDEAQERLMQMDGKHAQEVESMEENHRKILSRLADMSSEATGLSIAVKKRTQQAVENAVERAVEDVVVSLRNEKEKRNIAEKKMKEYRARMNEWETALSEATDRNHDISRSSEKYQLKYDKLKALLKRAKNRIAKLENDRENLRKSVSANRWREAQLAEQAATQAEIQVRTLSALRQEVETDSWIISQGLSKGYPAPQHPPPPSVSPAVLDAHLESKIRHSATVHDLQRQIDSANHSMVGARESLRLQQLRYGDESGSPTSSGRLISMNDRLLQHRYDAPLDSLVG